MHIIKINATNDLNLLKCLQKTETHNKQRQTHTREKGRERGRENAEINTIKVNDNA